MKAGTRVRVIKTGEQGTVKREMWCGDIIVYLGKSKVVLRFRRRELAVVGRTNDANKAQGSQNRRQG